MQAKRVRHIFFSLTLSAKEIDAPEKTLRGTTSIFE
jgi:hypothetical protein